MSRPGTAVACKACPACPKPAAHTELCTRCGKAPPLSDGRPTHSAQRMKTPQMPWAMQLTSAAISSGVLPALGSSGT
eukprot:scaffold61625_cov66-Phaeocystis_antarctica.AAC.1